MLGNLLIPCCNEFVSSDVSHFAINQENFFFLFGSVRAGAQLGRTKCNITATLDYSLQYTCSEKAKRLANPNEP